MQHIIGKAELLNNGGIGRWVLLILCLIQVVYLTLTLWEIDWGGPKLWHPDEKHEAARAMLARRSVNPKHYTYGGLAYYTLAIGSSLPVALYSRFFDPRPQVSGPELDARRDRLRTLRAIAGRLISVVLGAGLIAVTFLIGTILFGSITGLVAAGVLAVSPYFIATGHFATVDMMGNFWYWLAMLFAVGIFRISSKKWYYLAGVTLGLASGIKLDRVLGAVPLLVAHLLRGEGVKLGGIVRLACAVLVGYAVANLTIFVEPFEFVDGVVREMFFGAIRGSEAQSSYVAILGHLSNGMGAPLFALALVGMGMLIVGATQGQQWRECLWLLSTIIPVYLLFGSRLSAPWYAPFYFPVLAITVGYAFQCLLPTRIGRILAPATLVLALGWSLMQSVVFDYALTNDRRHDASAWLYENATPGAVIQVGHQAPMLDSYKFKLVKRGLNKADQETFDTWRRNFEGHEPYLRVKRYMDEFEALVRSTFGLGPRQSDYRPWYERDWAVDLEGAQATPDYHVVLVKLEKLLFEQLSLPNSGYELAAAFEPSTLWGLRPTFPFVNPAVYVFERTDGPR